MGYARGCPQLNDAREATGRRARAVLRSLTSMDSASPRVSIPAGVLAVLCGLVAGLATFAACAALWRADHARVASLTAESILLLTLVITAGVMLLAQPARLRRARVPAGRPMPPAWFPVQRDPIPVIAACIATPLAAGAGAAMLLFR
jgi:hypothetical protein